MSNTINNIYIINVDKNYILKELLGNTNSKSIKNSELAKIELEFKRYRNGNYEGQFYNGKRNGFGIYRWDSGTVYEG